MAPTVADRLRLGAAAGLGAVRWLGHAEDRLWTDVRFRLALEGTGNEGHERRVGLRYYALTERCDRLERLPAERRGVRIDIVGELPERRLYAFTHTPALWVLLYGMSSARIPLAPVVADWFWADPRSAQRLAAVEAAGGEIIPADGSFEQIVAAFTAGRHPGLAVDVAGGTPVSFLGKPASLRSGLAALALKLDASVVPLVPTWERGRPVVTLGPAIPPEGEPAELLGRIVAALEAPLLKAPEYWMPYTHELWPELADAHRDAFAESAQAAPGREVASVS
ncbi:MAG: hypothetical protein JHC95_21355 [Solirubrobacteraceae bacterium]|nr:hypothetical protein [Solirubrobacteraceae bacterium]